jgi:hypothetical protein
MARWGMAGMPPSEPLLGPALRVKIMQHSLDGLFEFSGPRPAAYPSGDGS